jgi:hypothetical protein
MKAILVFFAMFIFINIISIYIMGGFYNQTIYSKLITEFIAFFVACLGISFDVFFKR